MTRSRSLLSLQVPEEAGTRQTMSGIESTLLGHLEFLYGSGAAATLDELVQLMNSFAERVGGGSVAPFSEKDAVVITYGDMVSEPDRHPLTSLGDFLSDQVSDVVSTVHILPFYPYSSDDGFAVLDYLAVDPELGDWDDVGRVGKTFRLMFDAVLNHVSAQSEWFLRFRDGDDEYADYFTVMSPDADTASVFRPRELPLLTPVDAASGVKHVWTTFSADQVDLNYRNPAVLLAAIEVILSYVERGASVIRLDAIAFIWKELGTSCIHLPQTHRIIQLIRSVLEAVASGVVLITETNVPHIENVSYFGDGTNEAQLVYNFALPPLTLHALQTGDARVLTRWAGGVEPPSQTTTFFNFLASHDGIGVGGARGYLTDEDIRALAQRTEDLGGNVSYGVTPDGTRVPYELNINYLDALGDPGVDESDELVARRFLTSQAVMLAIQGVPGIYFHSLFGSRGWPDGVAATSGFRAINRQKLHRAELEADLQDPGSLRSLVLAGYRRLLSVRRSHSAFSPQAGQDILELHNSVFAALRTGDTDSVLCLHNVSGDHVSVDVAGIVGAAGATDLTTGAPVDPMLEIEPYGTVWVTGAEL